MRRLFLVFSLLTTASALASPPTDGAPHSTLVEAESAAQVLARLRGHDAEALAQAAESLAVLAVSCPFTRSALAAPVALDAVARQIDASRFAPEAQADWLALRAELAQHVAVLDALGVLLPAPGPGDGLAAGDARTLLDRQALAATEDPVAIVAALVEATPRLAAGLDVPTRELIERHSERVESATGVVRLCGRGPWSVMPGQPWRLGRLLHGARAALERLAPFATDDEARAALEAMAELLREIDATQLET